MSDPIQPRLPSSNLWFRIIADALPAYVAYVDERLHYVAANRMYQQAFGRTAEEFHNVPIQEVVGESYEFIAAHLRRALTGEIQHFDTYIPTVTGKYLIAVTHIPDRDEHGVVRGVIVHGMDVTQSRLTENTLARSEARFRALVEGASVGLSIGDKDGRVTYMNPTLLQLLGYTEDDVRQGRTRWDKMTPPEYLERDQKALEQLASTGRAEPYEKMYRTKDGREIPMLLSGNYIPSLSNSIDDIAVFFTDLTRQKQAEAALVQNEKLAAVGKLASSISHEINNPLEAVTNLLFIARQDDSLSQETREYLDLADRELRRVSQVASHTLRFHRQSTRPLTIAPDTLLDEVLTLYSARLINYRIQIQRDYAKSAALTCFESEIRQIFNNLIGNAIEEMRGGGTLLLRTRSASHPKLNIPGVRITISDSGGGINPAIRNRLFEAFFTTKGHLGTGLGLWISSRIAQKHHGTIHVRSSQNPKHRGTLFSVWLPTELHADAATSWH